MRILKSLRAIACAALLMAPTTASAVSFNLSYTIASGDIYTGMLDGAFFPNNDTVLINNFSMAAFNGGPLPISGPVQPVFGSQPLASISGATLDFLVPGAFAFGMSSVLVGPQVPVGGEPFVPANWTLSAKSIPEPSTLVLLGLGLAGLGFARRKRMI